MMMDDDDIFRTYVKYRLNAIYGSGPCSNCVIKEENKHLKAECNGLLEAQRPDIERECNATIQKALAKQREEMEREYKADLAEANYLINKKLFHEQLQCGRPFPKGEKEDECKTEVQEAKEENRAARESKDTD